MNSIIVDLTNVSSSEQTELIEFLNNSSGKDVVLDGEDLTLQKLKALLGEGVSLLEEIINLLPRKGELPSTCQKMQLLNSLMEFTYSINGLEASDLIPTHELETE
jgi:hypothetical protein